LTPPQIFAICANICKQCRCLPTAIGKLTRLQIYQIIFHKTDKEGRIPIPGSDILTIPEGPVTLEMELNLLDKLAKMPNCKSTPAEIEEMKVRLRAIYAKKAKEENDE
jgi:hypothetical protein